MLVRSPEQNLKMMGFDGYMTVLRQLAVHYPTLQGNKKLLKEMKARAFLVGIRANGANPTTANSPEPETLFKLARAEDIYLIDDTVLGQLFNPLGAPIEVILENMYQGLGSQWLSQNVKEITTPTGAQFSSHRSLSLEELIQQRAPLLLYDGQQLRNSKDVLPHAEAYLKTIKVVEVPSIEVSRRFQEVTKIQKTTACLMANRNTKSYFLYVTADFDHFDVASSLGRIIFKQVRLNDSLLLSTLLSTSLENLRRKGFPVDRILNLTQHLKLAKPVAELQKTAGSVEDLKQLQSMFPSIDPILIKTELERAQGTEDPLAIAANSIVEKATAISKTVTPTRRDAVPPSPQHREPTQGKTTEEQGGGGLSQMFNRFSGSMLKNLGIASPVVDKPHSVPPPNLPVTKNIDAPNTRTRSITPQSTQAIKSQLSQSVSTLSTIKDSQFRAQIPSDPDAVIPTPQSRENPCRIIADADLIQVQTIEGILLYVDRNVGQTEVNRLLSDDLQGLIRFSLVLKFLGQIFGIPLSSMAIYWDQTGDTIAFNRSRSLFFNARYYLGLHYVKVNHGGNTVSLPGSFSSQVPQILDEDLNTFYYWFMVLCHELAHNFVAAHDANHEFWMSSFAEQYLSRLIQSLQQSGLV